MSVSASSVSPRTQDYANMPAMLHMSGICNLRVPRRDFGLGSVVSRSTRRFLFTVLFAVFVTAFPGFAEEKSRDLAVFFGGHLTATGQFVNYRDGSTRGVRVNIRGSPDGDAFKLVEDTAYSDGEKHHKVWRFLKVAEGRYVGQRADLIGEATVEAHGNTIEIAYRAHVPTKDGKVHDLNFKENFSFTQSGTADYRLRVSLLFIPVGEAHLIVRKRPR